MKHARNKTNGLTGQMFMLPVYLVAVLALILGAVSPAAMADDSESHFTDNEILFADAEIFFELNNTDGDLGIHASIDGDAWIRLRIVDPKEQEMLNIFVQRRLRWQGLTQLFFESAEPTFDELPPERFFRRFPEGEYEIEGATIKGKTLESTAMLTHLLPAPPENITVNGIAVPEDCDLGPVPLVSGSVVINWDPVTKSHPELGITGEPIEVVQYQVVVEQLDLGLVFSVELPPDVTKVRIPKSLTKLGEEYKLEILVREASGNQTAVESCFAVKIE